MSLQKGTTDSRHMEDYKHSSLSGGRNPNGGSPRRGGPSRGYTAGPAVLVLTVLAGLSWWLLPVSMEREINLLHDLPEPQFAWNQITPSEALEYHDCFGEFQCARLDVPMDWHRSDGQGARVALAVTRLPAKVPVTDPRYGGAIVVNPGGPGGSGVTQVLVSGHNLQTIADASVLPSSDVGDDPKYFDIIGFDPRGVNNTTPGFSCFPNLFSQRNWELQAEADGMLGSSADSFMRNWQRAIALNIGCSQGLSTPSAEGDILGEHLNTPPVARDVLEIVERHGEWREKQAQRQYDNCDHDSDEFMLTRTEWRRGQEKLIYWGRSYGTVIGATFAALYPDRVERMVLDGVVDAQKYYSGVGPEPIADADNVFDKLTVYCDQMGEDCPFYVGGGPAAIKEAYKDIENSLFNASLAVQPSTTRGPEVVTWTDLKTIQRIAIYQPLMAFSYLVGAASDLVKGDGSALAEFKHVRRAPVCPSAECLISGPWSPDCQGTGQNELYAMSAILCGDADYMQGVDEEGFIQHLRSLRELSSTFGDYWAHTHLNCVGWKAKPKWRMPVPVTGNTSHPILLVNNILDPVTPLQSAKTMSAAFPRSVLLRQDSEGHCTLAAPSTCIAQSIRKYFQNGHLPVPGTVCDADLKPLLGAPNKLDNEDKTLDEIALDKALLDEALRPRTQFPL